MQYFFYAFYAGADVPPGHVLQIHQRITLKVIAKLKKAFVIGSYTYNYFSFPPISLSQKHFLFCLYRLPYQNSCSNS